jgi:ParB-like chromosome segregation protein Spo0J
VIRDLVSDFPVESRSIDTIHPYPDNAKIHSDTQVEMIANAIKAFGFDQPIVVDKDGVIIKGHGRRLAALRLGLKEVPVVTRTDLSEDAVKAARLSDNKVAEGEVDTVLVQKELNNLANADYDLAPIGFTERELGFMLQDLTELNEDAFVDDLDEAVAEVEAQTSEKIEAMKSEEVPLAKALGFKSVPRAKERVLNAFMLKLRADYELPADQAFMRFVEDLISEAA